MENKMSEKTELFKKILEVRRSVPYLQKRQQGHQYLYVGSSDVLGALREKMDEVGLLLIADIKEPRVTTTSVENNDRYGNKRITTTFFTELDVKYTWIDVETGQYHEIMWYGQGLDVGGEKGVGKALTYAEKYFFLKQFNIPTDQDDPDRFQQRVEETPQYIGGEQISELNHLINSLCKLRGTTRDEVLNYFNLKSLERLTFNRYFELRSILKKWVKQATKKANKEKQNINPIQEQSEGNTPVNVQENQSVVQQPENQIDQGSLTALKQQLINAVKEFVEGKSVDPNNVLITIGITDINNANEAQIKEAINKLQSWARKLDTNKPVEQNQKIEPAQQKGEMLSGVLLKKTDDQSVTGEVRVKLEIEENEPIYARTQEMIEKINLINEGQKIEAQIERVGMIPYIKNIRAVE